MESYKEKINTGTTIVGISYKEGIVLASDKRCSMGSVVIDKDVEKVSKISDVSGICIAGAVTTAQLLIRYLQSECFVYKAKIGKEMSILGMVTLSSNILLNNGGFPNLFIIGGFDEKGAHLYTLAGDGSIIKKKWAAFGSGGMFSMGVIESKFKENITKDEAIDLAITAINSSMESDCFSGNGILISIIDEKGYKKISEEEIKDIGNKINNC